MSQILDGTTMQQKEMNMAEGSNFQMAIDLLCCHLGISEEEARKQIGIQPKQDIQTQISETQQALMGLTNDK